MSDPALPATLGATREHERGGVFLAVVMILTPLILVVGAFTTSMTARTVRSSQDHADERALLAAESGIDQALFSARAGLLANGVPFARAFGDVAFAVDPVHLGSDGDDNDGDGTADEPDEDVFRVVSRGTFARTTRRVAAYLGKVSFVPALDAAFTSANSATSFTISGAARIDGRNHRLDGSLVGSGDVFGIGASPPVTPAHVLAELSAAERTRVNGVGGPPSVGVAASIDLVALAANARNAATAVLTSDRYNSLAPGPAIYFRDGDLALTGNVDGSGLLVVTGDLRLAGNVDFHGVILVLGDIDNSAGNVTVLGGILGGSATSAFRTVGTADVKYSTEAIDLANRVAGRYVSFNGWQELPRN